MKKILNKLIKGERGQALILVLILLLVGGLIIAPLLGYMSTGLIVGKEVYEKRMAELYAADAGVEDALHKIITKNELLKLLPGSPSGNWTYNLANKINDRPVYPIIITYIDEKTYKINSTATSDSGDNTTIESYINILFFTNFMNNAITAVGDVTLKPNTDVTGNITYNGSLDDQTPPGSYNGTISTDPIDGWPTAEQLCLYYWDNVTDLNPPWYEYAPTIIDVKNTSSIPLGLYRDGDLTIYNTTGDNLTLGGTVYVTGDLEVGLTKQDFTLDLNGQTIFVEGHIEIGGKTTITGSGCIIAISYVDFAPKMQSSPGDFVFVMSVEDTLKFAPNGDFYGSIAGNIEIELFPGNQFYWSGPPPELEYPGSKPSVNNVIQAIRTWEISLQ